MKYKDLVKNISEKTDVDQSTVDKVLKSFTTSITDTIKSGDSVSLVGYFTFKPKVSAARTGINPKTKEPISIPEKKTMSVAIGKSIKDALNEN